MTDLILNMVLRDASASKNLSYLIVKPTELVLHLEVGGVKDHKGHISSKKFPYKIYPEANSILYICSDV